MAILARWCFQRRRWVLVAWLALVRRRLLPDEAASA